MSSDNGIYILRTPAPPIKNGNSYTNQHGKFEYRVAHCQAIDNIDYSDLYLPLYFGNCKVFDILEKALSLAEQISKDIKENGYFTEYGICQIYKNIHFPNMTSKAAQEALDCYVGAKPLKSIKE